MAFMNLNMAMASFMDMEVKGAIRTTKYIGDTSTRQEVVHGRAITEHNETPKRQHEGEGIHPESRNRLPSKPTELKSLGQVTIPAAIYTLRLKVGIKDCSFGIQTTPDKNFGLMLNYCMDI